MLIAMLVTWVVVGKPHYASMETGQSIAYVFLTNPTEASTNRRA